MQCSSDSGLRGLLGIPGGGSSPSVASLLEYWPAGKIPDGGIGVPGGHGTTSSSYFWLYAYNVTLQIIVKLDSASGVNS